MASNIGLGSAPASQGLQRTNSHNRSLSTHVKHAEPMYVVFPVRTLCGSRRGADTRPLGVGGVCRSLGAKQTPAEYRKRKVALITGERAAHDPSRRPGKVTQADF